MSNVKMHVCPSVGRSLCYRSRIRLLTKLRADRGKPPPTLLLIRLTHARRDPYLYCKYDLIPVSFVT